MVVVASSKPANFEALKAVCAAEQVLPRSNVSYNPGSCRQRSHSTRTTTRMWPQPRFVLACVKPMVLQVLVRFVAAKFAGDDFRLGATTESADVASFLDHPTSSMLPRIKPNAASPSPATTVAAGEDDDDEWLRDLKARCDDEQADRTDEASQPPPRTPLRRYCVPCPLLRYIQVIAWAHHLAGRSSTPVKKPPRLPPIRVRSAVSLKVSSLETRYRSLHHPLNILGICRYRIGNPQSECKQDVAA